MKLIQAKLIMNILQSHDKLLQNKLFVGTKICTFLLSRISDFINWTKFLFHIKFNVNKVNEIL